MYRSHDDHRATPIAASDRGISRALSSRSLLASLLCAGLACGWLQRPASAQGTAGSGGLEQAATEIKNKLESSLHEFSDLQEQIASAKVDASKRLRQLELELDELRRTEQEQARDLAAKTLELTNIGGDIKSRKDEITYISGVFGEFLGNFESSLSIAELQQYRELIQRARGSREGNEKDPELWFGPTTEVIDRAADQLDQALGGQRFQGEAVDTAGVVHQGSFLGLGPITLFRSNDGAAVGTIEQRLNSDRPAIVPFAKPEAILAAGQAVSQGSGTLPLDPTLGNAQRLERTNESFLAHVQKGGAVMVPILILASLALLVAIVKWISLMLVKKPTKRRLGEFLAALAGGDLPAAKHCLAEIPGPVGQMLSKGLAHIDEPKELVEEVMYENVLDTRLKLQRMLPFIALTSSSAPLLGLLGTVTGIMNTFSLMTEFGSGDVRTLSSGISEALITTEFGLYVAIPSLLLFAFLSRKARAIVEQMEKAALAFLNNTRLPSANAG